MLKVKLKLKVTSLVEKVDEPGNFLKGDEEIDVNPMFEMEKVE